MSTTVVPGPTRLRDMFVTQQARMISEFYEVKAAHTHPGAIGDGSEDAWLKMLQTSLPARYRAEKAFVIDSIGNVSDQIDIVIHDRQYSPSLSNNRGGQYVPAESVYAVIEVKQDLTKGHVEYAGEKIASVRRLHRTNAAFQHVGGRAPVDRPIPRILGGLVTLSSGWSPPFGGPLVSALASRPETERVDFGCVLEAGAFDVHYDEGQPALDVGDGELALSTFFFQLLHRLQQVGTVPAIDYAAYIAGARDVR